MNMLGPLHEKHKYRLMLCSHKAVEVGAVCLALMVQGNLGGITVGHLATASKNRSVGDFSGSRRELDETRAPSGQPMDLVHIYRSVRFHRRRFDP
jgi:hypothetical protein